MLYPLFTSGNKQSRTKSLLPCSSFIPLAWMQVPSGNICGAGGFCGPSTDAWGQELFWIGVRQWFYTPAKLLRGLTCSGDCIGPYRPWIEETQVASPLSICQPSAKSASQGARQWIIETSVCGTARNRNQSFWFSVQYLTHKIILPWLTNWRISTFKS